MCSRTKSTLLLFPFFDAGCCEITIKLFNSQLPPRVTWWNFLFPEILPAAMERFHAHSNQCVYNVDGAQQSRNYACHKCGNAFTRKNNLYNHLKFQCGQLPRFNCPYCSYRTKHSSNVRSHIRRIHPHENVYVLDMSIKQDHRPR